MRRMGMIVAHGVLLSECLINERMPVRDGLAGVAACRPGEMDGRGPRVPDV